MICFANNLRGHVSRGAAGIFGIVGFELSRDPEISNSYIAAIVQYQILWL